eukprot:CAMPEP_0114583948 /NCGR_PEP_ID=MMETSP0125-20121206/7629_1 /TAXON_ID=485358 ORGANISM="Aristerostoma sp., Strain ATCC 50986" /NCGR_SAMPLE_ID=MMETSP0125 /ASSEMBLY_ACC=CAM_ASM_000245 /LENGTH=61 /DNA_ID=CAMNT_0001777811 /DNA_START=75 /DNA_END=260 /DNA_ORIENTATION=+
MEEMTSQGRVVPEWRHLLFSLLKCKLKYDDEEQKSEYSGQTPTPMGDDEDTPNPNSMVSRD